MEYWEGPTYGIKDRQAARPVAWCPRCGGEIFEETETGLCPHCEEMAEEKEREQMRIDRALACLTYENFRAFATSGAKTETDPDVMEQFVLEAVVKIPAVFSRSTPEAKEFCLNEFNRRAAFDKLDGRGKAYPFLSLIRTWLASDNELLQEWCEWLDPERGLEP